MAHCCCFFQAVTGSVFSSLIRDNHALSNLTSSINQFHNDGVIDGVELDWEWPVKSGEKKDRIKLIRYARVRVLSVKYQFYILLCCFFLKKQHL